MEMQTVLLVVYVAGVLGCGVAGDKRTIGGAGAAVLAFFATPLVAAPLLSCWPSKMEAEAYYRGKIEEAKKKVAEG